MKTKQRYHLLDYEALGTLLGLARRSELQLARRGWVEAAIRQNILERDSYWSESLAVGDEAFVDEVKAGLGFKGRNREVAKSGQSFVLRENEADYGILLPKIPF